MLSRDLDSHGHAFSALEPQSFSSLEGVKLNMDDIDGHYQKKVACENNNTTDDGEVRIHQNENYEDSMDYTAFQQAVPP